METANDISLKNVFVETVLVTPQMANEFLKKNKGNRPPRKNVINGLTSALRSNEWIYTHQGIAFSDCGNLIDGQHRLKAIFNSGKSARMLVVRNVPNNNNEAFNTIDQYQQRDVWKELGVKKSQGGALRIIIKFCEKRSKVTASLGERYHLLLKSYFDDLSLSESGGNHNPFNQSGFLAGLVAAMILTRDENHSAYMKIYEYFNAIRKWHDEGSDLATIPDFIPKILKTFLMSNDYRANLNRSFDARITYMFLPENWNKDIISSNKETVKEKIYERFIAKMKPLVEYSFGVVEPECFVVPDESGYRGDIIARIVDITPEIADRYIGDKKIFGYQYIKKAIEEGKWNFTHQGIAIDYNDNLLDGYRRLKAIKESGKSVKMMVYSNVHPNARFVIDRGECRNMSDVFRVTPFVAGVAKYAYYVDHSDEDVPDIQHKQVHISNFQLIAPYIDVTLSKIKEIFGRADCKPSKKFTKRDFVLGVMIASWRHEENVETTDKIHEKYIKFISENTEALMDLGDSKISKLDGFLRGVKVVDASKKDKKSKEISGKEALVRTVIAFDENIPYISTLREQKLREIFSGIKKTLRNRMDDENIFID